MKKVDTHKNNKKSDGRCFSSKRQRFYTSIIGEAGLLAGDPHLSVQALTKYIKRKFDADPSFAKCICQRRTIEC